MFGPLTFRNDRTPADSAAFATRKYRCRSYANVSVRPMRGASYAHYMCNNGLSGC